MSYRPESKKKLQDALKSLKFLLKKNEADYNYKYWKDPAWENKGELNTWDVSNITDMEGLFSNFTNFNEPIDKWDVSNVTNMKGLFFMCKNFNQPLNNWGSKVVNVKNMESMFFGCESFNQPLDKWDVKNVMNMGGMFMFCTKFNQSLKNWVIHNGTDTSDMFTGTQMDSANMPQQSDRDNTSVEPLSPQTQVDLPLTQVDENCDTCLKEAIQTYNECKKSKQAGGHKKSKKKGKKTRTRTRTRKIRNKKTRKERL